MGRVTGCVAVVVMASLLAAAPAAQVPEFDFYREFRSWMQGLPRAQRETTEQVAEHYRKKLTQEGVAAGEIDRRVTLITTRRQELENDFWNRFFTVDAPTFNTAPNAFLVSVVEGRKPGRALDVGMGEGRNALYLAKLGWDVTGFDPADKAVALARSRADALKLKLNAVVALDKDFEWGRDQWDVILFSWASPTDSAGRVVESLKPGGIVVVEAGRGWFPKNGLLKMFDALRILRYEDEIAASDFFGRREMAIARLVAEKPAQ
jgi:SAM-dependent methyltransferase